MNSFNHKITEQRQMHENMPCVQIHVHRTLLSTSAVILNNNNTAVAENFRLTHEKNKDK